MDLIELNKRFHGYWVQGTGNFAVVCMSARRIVLWPNLEIAQDAKHASCGRGCCYKDNPHLGYRLEGATPAKPAKVSASWQRWVDSQ